MAPASRARAHKLSTSVSFGSPATSASFDAAAEIVATELDPPADLHGTTAYRKHLAGVLTRRALTELTAADALTGASA